MCGRFVSSTGVDELAPLFGIERVEAPQLPLTYNVAPTTDVYTVCDRPVEQEPDGTPERCLRAMRWGLVPSWARDPSMGSRLINARVETAAEKPSYRRAFARRRCLIPADGYYEWHGRNVDGRKQPYLIRSRDGGGLAFAGLYEFWRDREAPADDPAAWLASTVILTTQAEGPVASLHDRMPVVLPRERWDRWLDPAVTDPEPLHEMLAPAADGLTATPVTTAVNNVRENGPHLLQPAGPATPGPD